MAIVVPLLIGSTGIGASLAAGASALLGTAVSASALATVAGIAFQVTGINDKINKAASKVFGEDLVNVANIFGTVYSAATGSWDISDEVGGMFGNAEGVATTVDDLYKPTKLTSDAWDAAGVANMDAATAAAAEMTATGTAGASIENLFDLKTPTDPAVTDTNGYDLSKGSTNSPSSVGTDTKETAFSQSKQTAPTQTTTAPKGATDGIATQKQAVPNAIQADAAAQVKAPGAPGGPAASPPKVPGNESFFDKLLNNKTMTPQLVSGAISGLAKGYSSGQAEKMAERRFNTELERLKNRPRVTYTIGSQEA